MCGILGLFLKKEKIEKLNVMQMLDSIKHRGPDGQGIYLEENIFLGHNRLAFQDLSENGSQPMWDEEKEICIVFNGEIYNFKEIKTDLSEFNFKSESDTEVILYAYKKWGLEKAIKKFNGMFSFCIYDKRLKKSFLVRDRVGIKPFVYYWDGNNFIFSSELKAIVKSQLVKKELNREAIIDYFIYRYIPAPKTIYKNIFKLEPGHYLELNLNSFSIIKKRYWKINPGSNRSNEKKIIKDVQNLLLKSIDYRMISDTDVGSFLSGGIDSSLISTIANKNNNKLKAFTIDLRPLKYSEYEFAKLVSKKNHINLNVEIVDKKEFKLNFDKILKYYDEPFGDSSMIPTFLLCSKAKNNKTKCILSGDGADELFYGYDWYKYYYYYEKMKFLNFIPFKKINFLKNSKINKIKYLNYNNFEMYRRIMFDRYTISELNDLFDFNFKKDNSYLFQNVIRDKKLNFNNLNIIDFNTFLPNDILYKVDIASMANSIEVRVPFLDHNIVNYVSKIDRKILFKNFTSKYLLKEISFNYLPNQTINRQKKGFSAPIISWLDINFKEVILNGFLVRDKILSYNKIELFFNSEKNFGKIWQLYIFEKWYQIHFLEIEFSDIK